MITRQKRENDGDGDNDDGCWKRAVSLSPPPPLSLRAYFVFICRLDFSRGPACWQRFVPKSLHLFSSSNFSPVSISYHNPVPFTYCLSIFLKNT
jgi:hypothetical protein